MAISLVIDEVNERVPVIAGTGASGTREAMEMTKYAKDAGATAALIVTPFYLRPADRGIYEHYNTIATEVDLPIILYNIPQCTGLPLPWQMVEDLAQNPNIVAVFGKGRRSRRGRSAVSSRKSVRSHGFPSRESRFGDALKN